MAAFKEIKISGFDESRPPRVRKEPYIDLFYQLSEEPPQEWCEDFERFGRLLHPHAKVDKASRCFINTYVNDMNVIPAHFAQLKQAVFECNTHYEEKLRKRAEELARQNRILSEGSSEQFKLNRIVESLDFED